jgi:DeoR/GlpR family transcriptional regulator of sugar metabolism
MKNLIAAERRKKLIEIVNSNGSVRIGEIAEFFGVSTETIRKDFIYLNNTGAIQKSFGGAIALNEFTEKPVDTRVCENVDKKQRIALKTLDFIKDGHVIFIDSGSTTLEFAKLIKQNKDIAVVTNSLVAANELMNTDVTMHFVGGEFSNITMSTNGFWTVYAINTVKFDIAILGTSGFQSHTGPSVKSFADAQTKREVIKNSKTKIVLADSSKFVTNAVVQYADWNQIDLLITDTDAPAELVECCRKSTEVVLV